MTVDSDLLVLGEDVDLRLALERDVAEGLTARPPRLPSKWLYDARGSALFEEITRTPEYYLTRVEATILEAVADEVIATTRPAEILEIGSGSSRKTRLLLEALHRHRTGSVYVPFDVSVEAVEAAASALTADYPWLSVRGIVGDFHEHLAEVPRTGRRLVACLGSTIGNFPPAQQVELLRDIASTLAEGDTVLLGADLVKDAGVLERAYDDAAGVTAAFTMNLVAILQRELGAEIDAGDLRHAARWNAEHDRIEIGLEALRPTVLRFPTLDLELALGVGEQIRTEVSSKYTLQTLTDRLTAAGLVLRSWFTDPEELFAVALVGSGDSPG